MPAVCLCCALHLQCPSRVPYSPRNSPGQNPGVGSLSLLQGVFPTQGSNPGLPHSRSVLYQLSHKESPVEVHRSNVSRAKQGSTQAFLVAQIVKNPPAMQKTPVQFLGQEDPLEERMATHSSILAWRIAMDREAWQAIVHGVAKSQTQLSN